MSYHNEEDEETDNDAGMLLNLSQKSSIFVADQTPTPTRLIKNCEEVGLFDDLRNVNPFEETFRRACENIQHPRSHPNFQAEEESLHTPQVFPQFDVDVVCGISAGEDLSKQTLNTPVVLDVPTVDSVLETPTTPVKPKSADCCSSLSKYRPISEKPVAISPQNNGGGITFLPSTLQFIQPQLITVTFPSSTTATTESTHSISNHHITTSNQKSLTKSHPLILPKLTTTTNTKDSLNNSTSSSAVTSTTSTTPHPEPSSASLTPTSQLPIKERLKAILNQSSKSRPPEWPERAAGNRCSSSKSPILHKSSSSSFSHKSSSKDDTMERRRAASTRYRQKMRNEHKDLKKRNSDLQTENDKLKQRIKQLEAQVAKLQAAALQPILATSTAPELGIPAQIQIPASTIHLVMNIPKLVVPCGNDVNNTQTILKNPITYRIDKN